MGAFEGSSARSWRTGDEVGGRSSAGFGEPTIGVPSIWAGIGQAQEGEDRGRDVGQVGLEVAAGGQAHAGEGDDAFGPVRAGKVGVGLDPGRARGELGADPVGLVGQRDQVGVSLAGRVDLVGLGGLDDLGKERAPVSGCLAAASASAAAVRASSICRGVMLGAAVLTPPCRAAQLT